MTVLRQEKSAIIEKLNTVFTGVIHHGVRLENGKYPTLSLFFELV